MLLSSRRGPGPAASAAALLALVRLATACAPAPGRVTPLPPAGQLPEATEEPAAQAVAPEQPDPCLIRPNGAAGPDTVRIVAGAPFAARQFYLTLVRLDCTGQPRPGLAESWSPADSGRAWILRLRPDARFWDGPPVTAGAVAGGWAADPEAGTVLRLAGITKVSVAGDRELRLTLASPRDSIPPALTDPVLGVFRRSSDSLPLIGTGAYRPAGAAAASAVLVPGDTSARPVRLMAAPRDLRDALDAGADLVVTDDPATLAYAATRPELSAVPLPWGRTYLLVTTDTLSPPPIVDPALRQALARDAVRVDARAAEALPPEGAPCAAAAEAPSRPGLPRADRIAYPAGDPTARDLAARLLALGTTSARAVVPLGPHAFQESLRNGLEAAYVVPLPHGSVVCLDPVRWPATGTARPLVDTREHVIVRTGAPAFTVDRDGGIRLRPGGM